MGTSHCAACPELTYGCSGGHTAIKANSLGVSRTCSSKVIKGHFIFLLDKMNEMTARVHMCGMCVVYHFNTDVLAW